MGARERFLASARAQGLEPEIHRFPAGTRTAAEAAAAVGCSIGQIVKSLVFMADAQPVLVLTSGANRVDEAVVAAHLGVEQLGKARANQVRDATGFAIGGTPPCGYPTPITTVMDHDLLAYDEVWAAAGTPDTCFPIAPRMLQRVTAAPVIDLKA